MLSFDHRALLLPLFVASFGAVKEVSNATEGPPGYYILGLVPGFPQFTDTVFGANAPIPQEKFA